MQHYCCILRSIGASAAKCDYLLSRPLRWKYASPQAIPLPATTFSTLRVLLASHDGGGIADSPNCFLFSNGGVDSLRRVKRRPLSISFVAFEHSPRLTCTTLPHAPDVSRSGGGCKS